MYSFFECPCHVCICRVFCYGVWQDEDEMLFREMSLSRSPSISSYSSHHKTSTTPVRSRRAVSSPVPPKCIGSPSCYSARSIHTACCA
jgi:hypothetical protein